MVLERARLSPIVDTCQPGAQDPARADVLLLTNAVEQLDVDAKLLPDLSAQRLLLGLTGVELAAGELPPTGNDRGRAPPGGEHATAADDRRADHDDRVLGHGGQGARIPRVTGGDYAIVLVAGVVAGVMNAIVGGGSLVTFPALVGVGLPPLQANVSNTIGVLPGSVGAVVGYRRELRVRRDSALRLASLSLVGGVAGAILLLALPEATFETVVPYLLVAAAGLTLLQPRITSWLAARGPRPAHGGGLLAVGVLLTGVYGGYFGAAQGVILLALLGILLDPDLQVANAVKNLLALVANLLAAVLFALFADVDWAAAAAVAIGATIGGIVGARVARRMPATALRWAIVVVALATAGWFLLTD